MRKRILWLLTAVIMVGTTAVALCSCSDNDDNPAATTPIGDKIVGKWYAETPKQVTIGTGEKAVECAKVVLVGTFDADGEGFWSYILVDKQDRAIQPVGKDGKEHPYYANCNYSVTGNTVDVELTANYLPTSQIEWTFNYNGTCLQTKYEDRIIDLHPITTGEDAMYQEWMRQLGFGFTEDEKYNINDKDITASNWRDQIGLYVYDGVGADVTDEKGRTGYTSVYLPWYKDGVVDTNLDPAFCDDITPENGWEWVLNLCGERSMVNNNFFAVYNKYSGVLRFFYYMPKITSGDDHMWEVDMTNMMAQRSVWQYGLPMDLKIADKAAIGQDKDNFFVDYITPYVRQQAQDGKISPNQGWWAFDVDLSLYRPDDKSFADDQSMSLQIRSWNESHVSLTSAITGKLEGDMQLDQTKTYTIVSKKKGVFGFIKDAVKIGKTAVAAITGAKKGDVKGAITNGISAAKDGYAFYGALKNNKNSSTTVTDTLSRITGTFNASIQADAETDGTISTSKPVTGAASPTIPAKQFITAGTHLGDGVWNLKTSPVVYFFNRGMVKPKYFIYFFDPSSVEVVLNPEVFPESDIEWVEVDAIAGDRKAETGNYRKAFGIPYSLDSKKATDRFPIQAHDYYWWFDFFYNSDEKYGMDYLHDQQYKGDQLISGRCLDSLYYIEPCVTDNVPNTEVNVSVVVKLKSMDAPMVYSRSYIPVVKELNIPSPFVGSEGDIDDYPAVYDQIVSKPKQNGKFVRGPIYDYQLKRLHSIRRYLDNEFEFKAVKTQGEGCYDIVDALTNGYHDDRWGDKGVRLELDNSVQEGNWNFEWSYDKPATPWAYEMSGIEFYETSREEVRSVPVSWKLYAKLNEGDEWTLLDQQTDNTEWYFKSVNEQWASDGPWASLFNVSQKKPWQYYRLEITKKSKKNNILSIPNFKLLY